MTTNNSGTRQPQHDLTAELNFLSRALKAPTLRDAAGRLTERAREESWTHEEFLVACLQREVSARESHGGESRIRAARFPARKSLEEFDFDHARGLQRDAIAHLNTWHGRPHDRRSDVAALQDLLPTVRSTVHVPVLTDALAVADAHAWADILARPAPVQFERVDFNDPLWVLYSSGTTGIPKGIVHSHGGVLLEHYKLLGLHHDLGPGDRFFWYTTTNWMMWNLVVSGLLLGSTIVVYDGSPTYPNPQRLWTIAADCRARVLGVSTGYLLTCAKMGVEPARNLDLSHLKILGSTGAPLAEQQYDWVRGHVGSTIQVASVSGGTDVVSGFAGSAPNTAVWAGELSAPMLGVALEARDENGRPVIGDVGELVVTEPMPSMPVFFWNDADGTRYRTSYFETYPGLWRHGDWVIVTERGSVVVTGRSDATLNRHGVRFGSADIYDIVEDLPEVGEALVVGIELDGGGYWMPLFVVPAPGRSLDQELRERITTAIRTHASPRHVPDEIIEVPAIPHTRTGKKIEIPIKRIVQGADVDRIIGSDTIDDPDALRYFTRFTRTDAASRTP